MVRSRCVSAFTPLPLMNYLIQYVIYVIEKVCDLHWKALITPHELNVDTSENDKSWKIKTPYLLGRSGKSATSILNNTHYPLLKKTFLARAALKDPLLHFRNKGLVC